MTYELCKLVLVKPGPGVQTPGNGGEAPGLATKVYIIVEGPLLGIYVNFTKQKFEEVRFTRVTEGSKKFPYRGGSFLSEEEAKNWVQVASVFKTGGAPAPLCMGVLVFWGSPGICSHWDLFTSWGIIWRWFIMTLCACFDWRVITCLDLLVRFLKF